MLARYTFGKSIRVHMCEWVQSQSNKPKRASNHKKNNQNLISIYVFPFKIMATMASYCFYIHMNVKEFKPKIHLMKF
jgi:hypothetical protein